MFANMMPLPSMTTATEIVFNRGLELLVPGAWDNVVCRVLIGQGHCMFLSWTIQWPEQLYVCVSNTILTTLACAQFKLLLFLFSIITH